MPLAGRRPWCGAAGGDDAFADSGAVDDLAHDLTDSLTGEGRRSTITAPLPADEQRPGTAGTHAIRYRTLFGDILVNGARYYLSLQRPSSQDV